MGLQDRNSEFFDWYDQSGQYQIDQRLLDEWNEKIARGEQLGVDFDQTYHNRVTAAAARLNAVNDIVKQKMGKTGQNIINDQKDVTIVPTGIGPGLQHVGGTSLTHAILDKIENTAQYFSGQNDEPLEWMGDGAGVKWPRLVDFVLDLGDGRQVKKTIPDPGNVLQGAPGILSGTMRGNSDGGYEVVAEWKDTTGFAKALAKWQQFNVMDDSSWYSPGNFSGTAETLSKTATVNKPVAAEVENLAIRAERDAEGAGKAGILSVSGIDPSLKSPWPGGPEKPPMLLQDTFRWQDNIRTRLGPSENLTRLLMNYERYEEFVYDPGDNTDTIGYGHVLLPGESYPNGISKKDAGLLLQKDLKERFTAKSLDPFLKEHNIKLTQNQYDALVLFTYNVGEYVWERDFNLKRMLINGNYTADDIIEGFWGWTTTGDDSGRTWKSGGLYRRRMDEANLFNNGIYERNEARPIPDGYE